MSPANILLNLATALIAVVTLTHVIPHIVGYGL
jgi:hypothetical protein